MPKGLPTDVTDEKALTLQEAAKRLNVLPQGNWLST